MFLSEKAKWRKAPCGSPLLVGFDCHNCLLNITCLFDVVLHCVFSKCEHHFKLSSSSLAAGDAFHLKRT